MIIKNITLHNFGLYADTNTFNLDTDKPVILIGGKNGRGKTTLLEAILLAFYGKSSFAFIESRLSYSNYLEKFINRNDRTLKTYIEVSFQLGGQSDKSVLSVRREWSGETSRISDNITVQKNGIVDQFLSNSWAMYIEEILPAAVSKFFFFDGEKISNLAMEQTGDQMRDSIKLLLGIDVLERAEKDLEKILRMQYKKISNNTDWSKIESLKKELESLAIQQEKIQKDIDEIDIESVLCVDKLNKFESDFLVQGGNLGESKKELSHKKETYESQLKSLNEQILERISSEIPLVMVSNLLKQILTASENEREQILNKITYQRMLQILDDFSVSDGVDENTVQAISSFIHSNAKQIKQNEKIIYNLSENGYTQAQMLTSFLLDKQTENLKLLHNQRKELLDKIKEIENYLMIDVDEHKTANTYNLIKELSAKKGEYSANKKQLESKFSEISSEFTTKDKIYKKLVSDSISDLELKDDTDRIIRYSSKAIDVIQAYKLRLQTHKASNLAEVVTDCYLKITNKKSLISHVTIDSVTLDFQYWGTENSVVPWNIMSAGEKQLIVTAILWALAKCSHNRLPVVIDTPLARLDSAHRRLMVKNYFPYASEQTIILSTDSEIDKQYYDILKPFIGKEYSLEYDDDKQSTTLIQGFFQE